MADNPQTEYNEGERAVLRQARAFSELVETASWKEFQKVLEAQIKTRETLALMAVGESQLQAFQGMDFATRVAMLELVKGAIVGLRLALNTPNATIEAAKQIVADHTPQEKSNG